uniref:ATPase, T2SS/T4P/T4SS family n=1 Tax=Maricaulis sp. TaxID=1486257 RepID=UPI0035186050
MFGKRAGGPTTQPTTPTPPPAEVKEAPRSDAGAERRRAPAPAPKPAPKPAAKAAPKPSVQTFQAPKPSRPAAVAAAAARARPPADNGRSEEYYAIKTTIFNALIDTIDLGQLARLDNETAAEEIRDIVTEIISIKNVAMSIAEQEQLLQDICNDVLGFGPLEPLLARDDIADIMINGAEHAYIEVNGKVKEADIRFRDNQQLLNICQRIVSQVGRRVDESSPICDARLPDGSRVNVIAPPLAIDGAALTIRKFKKDKLTLQQLVKYNSISPEGAEVLRLLGRVRA